MILELEVFNYDEDDQSLMDIGESPKNDLEEGWLIDITFYNVDFIRPYKDMYCEVCSGGELFLVNEPYNVVQEKIKEQMNFKFN